MFSEEEEEWKRKSDPCLVKLIDSWMDGLLGSNVGLAG